MRNRATWVAIFFVAATGLFTLTFDLALSDLFAYLRLGNQPLLGPRFTTTTLIAFGLAAAMAIFCTLIYRAPRIFVDQSISEMDKVHWPTWPETRMATFTVVVFSTVAALVLGVFDSVFSWLTANDLFLR